jgi:hypothetical protein
METILGFVAGYIAGAQDGRGGLERLRTSLRAIRDSPQTRRLAGEALTVAGIVARRASSEGLGGTVGGVTEMLVHRATAAAGRRDGARAA